MNFKEFVDARKKYNASDTEAKFPPGYSGRGVHVLWMYPDILHMHGGKGNLMALARHAMLLGIPLTIKKCISLKDEIDFEWADIILFESGDLSVMRDVAERLNSVKSDFINFAESGKIIMAIGTTGAVLAKETIMLEEEPIMGLGLLGITMKERNMIFGDDLWFKTKEGIELIGTEVQRVDTILDPEQSQFGNTIYGRGNSGTVDNSTNSSKTSAGNTEGARTKNVIFTNCLGPVFARNPEFSAYILKLAAEIGGLESGYQSREFDPEDIRLELDAFRDMKEFIMSKQFGHSD